MAGVCDAETTQVSGLERTNSQTHWEGTTLLYKDLQVPLVTAVETGWSSFMGSQEASANSSTHQIVEAAALSPCRPHSPSPDAVGGFFFFISSISETSLVDLKKPLFLWKHESSPLFSTYSTSMKVTGLLKERSCSA